MMKTIAERMKHARGLKSWTQPQLAVAAGVSTGTIGNIESGARQAKGSLPQIAEALGVNLKWLAYGEGDMHVRSDWPYASFSPKQYNLLDKALRDEVEDRLLGAIMRQEKTTGTHN
jgi:transcriptional regulator with XRE-family HTH domain